MERTPEAYIRRQSSRRRHHRIIPPAVTRTLVTLPVTTRYRVAGDAWSLGYHTGEDHAGPLGSLVNSVSWGTVVCVARWTDTPTGGVVVEAPTGPVHNWGTSYGTHVVIRTASGSYDVGYCHLADVLVAVGNRVRPGQTIGHLGVTGHTTGPHLHLEARPAGGRFGSDVDPLLVKRWGVNQ